MAQCSGRGIEFRAMQLVQIGVARQKTVLDMVQELAERQSFEIQQLKRFALDRAARKRHRAGKQSPQRAA